MQLSISKQWNQLGGNSNTLNWRLSAMCSPPDRQLFVITCSARCLSRCLVGCHWSTGTIATRQSNQRTPKSRRPIRAKWAEVFAASVSVCQFKAKFALLPVEHRAFETITLCTFALLGIIVPDLIGSIRFDLWVAKWWTSSKTRWSHCGADGSLQHDSVQRVDKCFAMWLESILDFP